eukprot:EST42151.1 hypothetical protein SS50377_18458 [Spironucleus salmonicida]
MSAYSPERRTGFNTLYQQYLKDPEKQYYIKLLQYQQCDENLLWIVDNLVAATAPLDETREVFEKFYKILSDNLIKVTKSMQYNSLEFIYAQKPPTVVRDIISMCAYLQIDIQSPYVWLSLVALSLGLPSGWSYDDDTGEYICLKNEERTTVHPSDYILKEWKDRQIQQTGHQILVKLTEQEQFKVGPSFIVVYDFKDMRTKFVGKMDMFQPDLISIPILDEENINYQINNHIELAGALIEANELVFQGASGDVTLLQDRGVDSEINTVQETYNIMIQQNEQKAKSKFVKQFGYNKQRLLQNDQEHYLLKLQQSLLPDVLLDKNFIISKLLPPQPSQSRFLAYQLIDKRKYQLIFAQSTQLVNPVVSQLANVENQHQIRLTVYITNPNHTQNQQLQLSTTNASKFDQSMTPQLTVFNDLNGYVYPFETHAELPSLYDFYIGKSVSCRGINFILTQNDPKSQEWFTSCGKILKQMCEFIYDKKSKKKVTMPRFDQVFTGREAMSIAIEKLIKYFYACRLNGIEVHADELAAEALTG